MLAILIFERTPLQAAELPAAMKSWLQDAGGVAAVALIFYFLGCLLRNLLMSHAGPERESDRSSAERVWLRRLFGFCVAASALSYLLFGLFLIMEWTVPTTVVIDFRTIETWTFTYHESLFLTAGGAFALLAVAMPVLLGLRRLSGRRIWAIARLSIKETVRQRVLWVFTLLLLVVLFASWFIDSDKPEFQLRNYVWVVDGSMTVLLLLAASLLAGFSIPADVRSQTIHTVVTKPVERFEIVLGRFLGYTLLMTGVLAVVTGVGMLYLFRNINEEAKRENYKARVPIYGDLSFQGPEAEHSPREWSHRLYLTGGSRRETPIPNYAIWALTNIPAHLAERDKDVRCEFSFDIYRTHKGEEGKGVFCSFLFASSNCKVGSRSNGKIELDDKPAITLRQKRLEDERRKETGRSILTTRDYAVVAGKLAEEFGFFEVSSQEVKNYHTQQVLLPVGLFKNAQKTGADDITFKGSGDDAETPSLRIFVNVSDKSRGQLVGVARHDLYLLDYEKSFEENFIKGAIGLWFRLCLLIGIAVACSTYLSGIISWMCAMFLFGLGIFKDQIRQVTLGSGSVGGGPMESMLKLASGKPVSAELDKTATTQVAVALDEGYRWFMNYLLKLIPDVNRFDLSQYVANGFDISWSGVLLLDNLIPLVGYLIPWTILAYYMIKSREIANPT